MIACFPPETPPPKTPTTVGSPSPVPPGKLQEARASLAGSRLFPQLAASAQARQGQGRGDAAQTPGDALATPTRPPRPLNGPPAPADAIPLIPPDRVPPPAPAAEPRAKKRGRKSDAGSKAKRPKKPAAKKKKRKAPPAEPRPQRTERRKRAKPEPPVAVYRPSCMELFGTDGDRGEDACARCKNERFYKYPAPQRERFSRVPKSGYVDKAGTRWNACKHPDGPQGR